MYLQVKDGIHGSRVIEKLERKWLQKLDTDSHYKDRCK